MCGRFNIISDPLTRLLLEITGMDYGVDDRFNVAPTEQIPVIAKQDSPHAHVDSQPVSQQGSQQGSQSGPQQGSGQGRRAAAGWDIREMRRWLVPSWVSEPTTKYSMFNARAEGLSKSRAFQQPFKSSRCIVPVSGYYEWRKASSGKVPYCITPAEQPGFPLAGLWDRWQRGDQVIESCTIITCQAHPSLAFIHPRMPVCLDLDQIDQWLDGATDADTLQQMLLPKEDISLEVIPVSTYVSNSRNKGQQCIEPIGDTIHIH